jgi:hypothetical protein
MICISESPCGDESFMLFVKDPVMIGTTLAPKNNPIRLMATIFVHVFFLI